MKALAREKLGTEPIGRLLAIMAAPSIVAMVMQALYNTVDSIFVSRISHGALAAVTLAFPIQMITGALSTGIGVGINSSISRNLGSGHEELSSKAAGNGLILGLFSLALMVLFGLFGTGWYLGLYTTDPEVISAGMIYIRTICILSFGSIFTQISFSILQGSGNMVIPMMSQIAGAVCVIGLDPLFILVFKMGILGAALASSTAQVVAMCIGLYGVFIRNRHNLPVTRSAFKPEKAVIKDILVVGVPSALTQATTSIVSGIVSKIIARYGTAMISVYGGYTKFSSFGQLPVFGVTRGMNPILGYSYGAKDKGRFTGTLRRAVVAGAIITALVGLFFLLFPGTILKMIDATDEMRAIGMRAYRILSIVIIISGPSIVLSQSFPPAKRSYLTMIYSLVRQVVFLIPICLLMSANFGEIGVWFGLVITDSLGLVTVIIMHTWFVRAVLNKWPDKPVQAEANDTATNKEESK